MWAYVIPANEARAGIVWTHNETDKPQALCMFKTMNLIHQAVAAVEAREVVFDSTATTIG